MNMEQHFGQMEAKTTGWVGGVGGVIEDGNFINLNAL